MTMKQKQRWVRNRIFLAVRYFYDGYVLSWLSSFHHLPFFPLPDWVVYIVFPPFSWCTKFSPKVHFFANFSAKTQIKCLMICTWDFRAKTTMLCNSYFYISLIFGVKIQTFFYLRMNAACSARNFVKWDFLDGFPNSVPFAAVFLIRLPFCCFWWCFS